MFVVATHRSCVFGYAKLQSGYPCVNGWSRYDAGNGLAAMSSPSKALSLSNFPALLRLLQIALELPRIGGLTHQMPNWLNRSFASLAW